MKTENNTDTKVIVAKPAREIPMPPGGGSWRFNEVTGEWIDLNPQPEAAAQPSLE